MSGSTPLDTKKIVLVGNPNVGKSVIFRLLTGSYVLVSNFPGTTVEVSRGRMELGGQTYEVVDTPGINSLIPQSEDERVACEILLREKPDVIVQVADAKNLRRTLLITSQLVEFDVPMVLALNMIDEAEDRGIEIDSQGLSELFSIPVVETIAIFAKGRRRLLSAIQNAQIPENPLSVLHSENKAIRESRQLAPPGMLSIEWINEGNRELLQTVAECQDSDFAKLKKWQDDHQASDKRHPANDPRYSGLDKKDVPATECLKDTVARFLPYWHETIAPTIKSGKRVIIAAHGNSLRALVKYLDDMLDEEIIKLNIPTGVPLVYELDGDLKPVKHYYLGDPEAIKKAMDAVSKQGKSKKG